jgi:hypothetical protein
MNKFKPADIVKVSGQDIVGRVIETFDTTTKMMTRHGEKTFPSRMLEQIGAYNRKNLVIHPEQQQLREYYAGQEVKSPAAAKFFRLMAEELLALAGWYPCDGAWHFVEKADGGSNLAIRVPSGKTSNIFHLSCHADAIRVEMEGKKRCPPELAQYFPQKGIYSGGKRKDIAGPELNAKYIQEYIEVLKTVYKHNTRPQ